MGANANLECNECKNSLDTPEPSIEVKETLTTYEQWQSEE